MEDAGYAEPQTSCEGAHLSSIVQVWGILAENLHYLNLRWSSIGSPVPVDLSKDDRLPLIVDLEVLKKQSESSKTPEDAVR